MAIRSVFRRNDRQSNVVDEPGPEVDAVFAGQLLLRSNKTVSLAQILEGIHYIDSPVIWSAMLENPATLSISRSNF
jgi:hypothetical protein